MTDLQLPQGITAAPTPERGFLVDTALSCGTVMAHGAQVIDWAPRGQQPVLWLSEDAVFEPGSSIRGGVPICFPWFGRGPAGDKPGQHGFARRQEWTLVEAMTDDSGEGRLSFELLGSSVEGQDQLPSDAKARFTVAFGTNLTMTLTVTAGEQAFTFEEALHTYYAVGDVRAISVVGLDGANYLDCVGERTPRVQTGAITFDGVVDRIYADETETVIVDPKLARKITVDKANSASTIVWNPGEDAPKSFTDIPESEWTRFVCVESGNVGEAAISLEPGQSHTMTVTVSVD